MPLRKFTRKTGPSESVFLPSGNEIIVTPCELLPDYGRNNVEWTKTKGWSPDMQKEQADIEWNIPDEVTRRRLTDPRHFPCPMARFVGNMEARKILQRAAYAAWGRPDHCCTDLSFALVGPASAGKTTLARLFAETVGLPFVEIPPRGMHDSLDFYNHVAFTLERTVKIVHGEPVSMKIVPPDPTVCSDPTVTVPPCIVFIDEVHGLPRNLVENLLKAIESKDRMFCIDNGWYADCKNVCWVVATTERGKLFGPFDSRFTKVELDMYTAEEVAMIVFVDNTDWDRDTCRLVSRYCGRIPREALDFAKAMRQERDLNGGDWETVAARVAKSLHIDRYGLSRRRLNVLVALGQLGSIPRGRMTDYAGCAMEELERFVMPALLVATTDDPAMVAVTNKGYAITCRGLDELDRRGIPHRGAEVVTEGGHRLDFGCYDPEDFGTDLEPKLAASSRPDKPKRHRKRLDFSDMCPNPPDFRQPPRLGSPYDY